MLYLRIRYNIFLRHNIAFTYCLHIKGQLFFFFLFFFSVCFYFYCLVLVNPMIITCRTKCTDLVELNVLIFYCVLSKQDTCYLLLWLLTALIN